MLATALAPDHDLIAPPLADRYIATPSFSFISSKPPLTLIGIIAIIEPVLSANSFATVGSNAEFQLSQPDHRFRSNLRAGESRDSSQRGRRSDHQRRHSHLILLLTKYVHSTNLVPICSTGIYRRLAENAVIRKTIFSVLYCGGTGKDRDGAFHPDPPDETVNLSIFATFRPSQIKNLAGMNNTKIGKMHILYGCGAIMRMS